MTHHYGSYPRDLMPNQALQRPILRLCYALGAEYLPGNSSFFDVLVCHRINEAQELKRSQKGRVCLLSSTPGADPMNDLLVVFALKIQVNCYKKSILTVVKSYFSFVALACQY